MITSASFLAVNCKNDFSHILSPKLDQNINEIRNNQYEEKFSQLEYIFY